MDQKTCEMNVTYKSSK